jgi:hypothetical protein
LTFKELKGKVERLDEKEGDFIRLQKGLAVDKQGGSLAGLKRGLQRKGGRGRQNETDHLEEEEAGCKEERKGYEKNQEGTGQRE